MREKFEDLLEWERFLMDYKDLFDSKDFTYTGTNEYMGITHCLPRFLLKPWKHIMCKKNVHVFDEVWSSHPEHYLSCDACGLVVHIESIDKSWHE